MPAPIVATVGKFVAKKAAAAVVDKIGNKNGGGKKGPNVTLIAIVALAVAAVMVFIMVISILAGALGIISGSSSSALQDNACTGQTGTGQGQTTVGNTVEGIPDAALDAYVKAGKASGIDWVYIAALGKIESQHGLMNGGQVLADGDAPGIYGIALDGTHGTQAIRDTDDGHYDLDTTWDRAVGPMQMIPSTWEAYKVDGNGDGQMSPQNFYDAAAAAASLLKANGAPGDMDKAYRAYNNSAAYVTSVMNAARDIRTLVAADAQRSADLASLEGGGAAATSSAPASGSSTSGSKYAYPLADGTYQITSGFGSRDDPGVGTGTNHDGLDFGAPAHTPIMAIADGTVLTAGFNNGGYGNWVRIQHSDGVVSLYGHMFSLPLVKVGDVVRQGQVIGEVGSTGASTGNHLHLGIYPSDGAAAIDPAPVLEGAVSLTGPGFNGPSDNCGNATYNGTVDGATGAWGGFSNGQIPADQLCPLDFAPNHRLRCDAATAMNALNAAAKHDGDSGRWPGMSGNMVITDSYRSYEAQVVCRQQKGNLCADPGTSNHGWGMAVDFGGGVENGPSSRSYQWLEAHAAEYGWVHPSWAQPTGSKPEAWHWEFAPATGGDA
jgi:murein DD-endopeptidase MepM/ murein hydrolase activator NlpD